MGNSSQTNILQRRVWCWGIFQRQISSTEHIRDRMRTSIHQQQGRDPAPSSGHMEPRRRYTPYAIAARYQRVNLHKHEQMYANRGEGSKPPERPMEENKQVEVPQNWFKVTIPFGIRYEEKWLLNLIQSQRSLSFNPVEISIFISPCDIPRSVKELKTEEIDQTKMIVNKRCDTSQQDLTMQKLPFDQDSMTPTTDMALIPRSCMTASLNICERNMTQLLTLDQSHKKPHQLFDLLDTMPMASNTEIQNAYKNELQVKSLGAIVKEKSPNPEDICAERSSLCTTIPDKSSNKNSILELFPKLLSLDGQGSPESTVCSPGVRESLPTCKGSFFASEVVKSFVLQFLQQYYWIYDHADRQELLNTYHAEACFSLSMLFTSLDSSQSSLCEYFKYSRNMKILKDPYMWRYLLKHKKCNIVYSLRALPKTQHDLTSFVVDICFQNERMVCFSVNGMFMEKEGRSPGCIRAFTRTFIATLGSSSNLCIVNDKLFVRNVQEFPSAFISMVTPFSNYLPALSQEQQEMVRTFHPQSRMNLEWAQKCLYGNHWNYRRAMKSLALPRVRFGNTSQIEDTIPEEPLTEKDLES